MRRTASEVLADLEIRVARLEREAAPHSLYPAKQMQLRGPRRQRGPGALSLRDISKHGQDLLKSARMLGFTRASLDFDEDNVVIDLGIKQHKIYIDAEGYHLIFPPNRTMTIEQYPKVKILLARQAFELGLRDTPDASPRHPDRGMEEVGMESLELTPSFDDLFTLLTAEGGYMGERWRRLSDSSFVGGDYTLEVKTTPRAIKFQITGPYLKRGEPVSTISGQARAEGRDEQLTVLANRLDAIATQAGNRHAKARQYVLKLLMDYR